MLRCFRLFFSAFGLLGIILPLTLLGVRMVSTSRYFSPFPPLRSPCLMTQSLCIFSGHNRRSMFAPPFPLMALPLNRNAPRITDRFLPLPHLNNRDIPFLYFLSVHARISAMAVSSLSALVARAFSLFRSWEVIFRFRFPLSFVDASCRFFVLFLSG